MKILPPIIIIIVLASLCTVNAQSATASPATPIDLIDISSYPTVDKTPDINSPQVKAWLKELDLSKVPNLPISNGGKLNPLQAQCGPPTVIQPDQGSWTCQKFTAESDIALCPEKNVWGVTYDDGPSAATPKLLTKLKEKNIKATFFVIGSRIMGNPQILKDAFDAGHHIAVHTWSHPALTSLPNESVVAELKWTIKAIKEIIGLTPVYMRPPYGDTDNRVRAIATACGLKTVLWVPEFDSNDWVLNTTPPKSPDFVLNIFETWMQAFPKMNTGFIALQHDLYPETVDVAIKIIDRAAKVPNLKIMSVPQCIGDNGPYLEISNTTNTGAKSTPSSPINKKSSANTISFTVGSIITVLFTSLLNLN